MATLQVPGMFPLAYQLQCKIWIHMKGMRLSQCNSIGKHCTGSASITLHGPDGQSTAIFDLLATAIANEQAIITSLTLDLFLQQQEPCQELGKCYSD